jgi:predicted ATP-binding protein involved in virulence
MRLKRISVSRLFNFFDHDIPLHEKRITILHGPNGFGKTIVLRMTDGLLNGNYSVFAKVPFGRFLVAFEDGSELSVVKIEKTKKKQPGLDICLSRGGGALQTHQVFPGRRPSAGDLPMEFLIERVHALVPNLSRVGPMAWLDGSTGETLDIQEVVDRYGRVFFPLGAVAADRNDPEWLQQVRTDVKVKFIRTQRLDGYAKGERGLTVERYAKELAQRIKSKLAEYASHSQDLDRTFPSRLFQHERERAFPVEQLKAKLAELDQRRRNLTALGFLDPEDQLPQAPERAVEERRDVLSVYVEDTEKKLEMLQEMADKISLFAKIVNDHFLFKQLKIHRDKGFVIESEGGAQLSPSDLSSGEQHELILLYDLLFEIAPNSLVLIDEPEISLHVAWQERFLPDLIEMVQLSEVDVVIATHSPEIIGDHWDLAVELKAPDRVG